nr:MAG TPA: hypothetical protein [Caudoviricetes sp.]
MKSPTKETKSPGPFASFESGSSTSFGQDFISLFLTA